MISQSTVEHPAPWPLWPTLAFSCLIFLAFIFASMVLGIGFAVMEIIQNPNFSQPGQQALLAKSLEENGDFISLSSIVSGLAGIFAITWSIRLRQSIPIKKYLSLNGSSLQSFVIWNGLMYALLFILEKVAEQFSQTTDYVEKALASSGSLILLYFAVVVMAPLFEELFFRGFMFKGLEKTKIGPWGTIILTSLIWSVIHLQYSPFFIGIIFTLGLLLGYARLKSQSIWVPISMHALNNLLAMVSVGMIPAPLLIFGFH